MKNPTSAVIGLFALLGCRSTESAPTSAASAAPASSPSTRPEIRYYEIADA